MDLVGDIDDILSFVEDVDVLKYKLRRFASTTEQILLTIDTCSSWMKKYLEANLAGNAPCCGSMKCSNKPFRSNMESLCRSRESG